MLVLLYSGVGKRYKENGWSKNDDVSTMEH